MRREYKIDIILVNSIEVSEVIIDSHVDKHPEVNDELILELVKQLDKKKFEAKSVKDNYSYFVTIISLSDRNYRLVWLLEKDKVYIGVITAFRDSHSKGDI